MATTVKARTARKAHLCEGCQGTQPTIAAGHRYLLHTAFPDGYEIVGDAPYSVKECAACAVENGRELRADACETYCCGVTPCARPFGHRADHSCRRCMSTPTEEPTP